MADEVDFASEREERERVASIAAARASGVSHKAGPALCVRCREQNDQARDGYAICSDCSAEDELSDRVHGGRK